LSEVARGVRRSGRVTKRKAEDPPPQESPTPVVNKFKPGEAAKKEKAKKARKEAVKRGRQEFLKARSAEAFKRAKDERGKGKAKEGSDDWNEDVNSAGYWNQYSNGFAEAWRQLLSINKFNPLNTDYTMFYNNWGHKYRGHLEKDLNDSYQKE
jgi:hypothetical protein